MIEIELKEPVIRVKIALKKFNENLKITILNTSARTAKDAAKSLNCEVGAIVKSLLIKTEKKYKLCLISGDKKCSLSKLKRLLEIKDICLASPNEVKIQTGYTIGGVSPVGHINEIEIMVDNTLNRFDKIFAAAGHPNSIFEIDFENLVKLTKGKIMDISE